jgi:nucleoside-diphosphate-sugar epimerase
VRVLVTGANGFVGRALVETLRSSDVDVICAVRGDGLKPNAGPTVSGDLCTIDDWQRRLAGVDSVIHLAARAHVTRETARDPLAVFRANNVQPTLRLFRECQTSEVRRFVFVSSIGVNGVATTDRPFRHDDVPHPTEPYAFSKWEAERGLKELSAGGVTELVILRPALVYGPHAKGNFLRLLRLVRSGCPLPFGSITAPRSVLSLTRLCSLLQLSIERAEAAGQVFLAADRETVSTRDLVVVMAKFMKRPSRLISVPPKLLSALGGMAGFGSEVKRLTSSLVVDAARTRDLLGWDTESNSNSDMQAMIDTFTGENHVA